MLNISGKIFESLNVSDADTKMYKKVLGGDTKDKEMKVVDHFMKVYVFELNARYQKIIESVLLPMLTEELSLNAINQNVIGFQAASKAYIKTLNSNFAKVVDLVFGSFTDRYNITEKGLFKSMREEVFAEFDRLTFGRMTMTERDVLKHVRTLQREIIQRNAKLDVLKNNDVLDEIIEREKRKFRADMLRKYPDLQKALDEGKVLKSRAWLDKDGNAKYRTYTLDEYTEMSVSETIKNLDRTCAQVDAEQNGERVVEFYLRDNRKLKTHPNEVCKHIIEHKVFGKSILALDEGAAAALDVWTVNKARAEGSMNIAHYCRHSVRRITDRKYLNQIDKVLYVATVGANYNKNAFEIQQGE